MTQTIPRPRDREGRGAGAAGPESLLVCAPLRVEARAVRRGLDPARPATVLRTGFPGDFYINYHLYRLSFPLSALGRYVTAHTSGGSA